MVLLTVVIGVFALTQLARINAIAEKMTGNWLSSIQYTGEIQGLLNDLRQAETQHAMAVTAEEKKVKADRINTDKSKLAEVGIKIEKLMDGAAEKQDSKKSCARSCTTERDASAFGQTRQQTL